MMTSASLPILSRLGLRQVLAFDACTGLGLGLVLVLAPRVASSLLGVPETVLLMAALILFPSALLMGIGASQKRPVTALVLLIVIGNVLWVLASLICLAGLLQPSGFGKLFIALQALLVAALAGLELHLWRQRA